MQNTYESLDRKSIIIFSISNVLKKHEIIEATIFNFFQNIFGLNLIFFFVVSNYFSRPFNKMTG
jgi:hypothetical protein